MELFCYNTINVSHSIEKHIFISNCNCQNNNFWQKGNCFKEIKRIHLICNDANMPVSII